MDNITTLEHAIAVILSQAEAMRTYCMLVSAYLDGNLMQGNHDSRADILYEFTKQHLELIQQITGR